MKSLYPTFRAGMDDTPEDHVWDKLSPWMTSDFPIAYPRTWLGMFALRVVT